MPAAVKDLTLVQFGKETTRGTAVAASRRLPFIDARYRRIERKEDFAQSIGSGSMARAHRVSHIVENRTELQLTKFLDFKTILYELQAGLIGGVTPTTPGSGSARLWTFTPPVAADPVPTTYTVEFVESSGTDEFELEATYCFCTGFKISGQVGGTPRIVSTWVGRKTQESTKTGALTVTQVDNDGAPDARWAVYFNDTWATLGNTQISAQIKAFEFSFGPFLKPGLYLDNRSDLDFSRYDYAQRQFELSLDVLVDPAATKFVKAEAAFITTPTRRNVRLQLNGTAFGAPDSSLNRFVRIDGAYTHAEDSMQERGQDDDGLMVVRAHLTGYGDVLDTSAQDVEISVQNSQTAWP